MIRKIAIVLLVVVGLILIAVGGFASAYFFGTISLCVL